ncbi:unnamed protein product [Caenorhabditis auriculariae]|uniref:PDZ domain-containing protein n=1 Tax=Caenorhabditis auriculariae TaxID=2777116 RepID=A0A8S1HV24_9PELO|nr:unnamed protein product [Caenorhabditis auriculariae]
MQRHRYRMTYETISVRMNRSDTTIRWGFTIRAQGDQLIIDRVEAESLSDKAGVKEGDRVESINGRPSRGVDAHTANRLVNDAYNEVRLSLQRYVASHTCLPWTLSEKDNKMVVEEARPGFGSGFGHGTTNFSSTNTFNNSSSNNFSSQNQYSSIGGGNYGNTGGSFPGFGGNSNASRSSHHQSQSVYNSSSAPVVIPTNVVNNSSQRYNSNFNSGSRAPFTTNSSNNYTTSTSNSINQATNYNSIPTGFTKSNDAPSSYGSGAGANNYANTNTGSAAPPASFYGYNGGAPSDGYGKGAGGVPLNQFTYVQTNNLPASHDNGGLSPGKMYYHSPSSRSKRDLSPGASIQHLQYNSPMNLYSSETAADQYFQQTGVHPENPPPRDSKTPAYLTSETKKLIEEEARGRSSRGRSPSSQSSCFKRISHAVGADL